MSDLVNQTLGKYKVVARLGRGGMADVYKAFNPNLQRHVAIKLLHGYPAEREIGRFEQEAAAVARLRHPNIVRVFDFDVDGGQHYMVMELVDGPTLEAKLKADTQKGEPNLAEIARIFTALASAIDYAHSRGMVHHDLKPANVMFTDDGEVVLMDFGIARIVGEMQHTATDSITGTPAYMSPEQCKGLRGDRRSDIYSLGIILYEMVCGRTPFQAENVYGYIKAHIGEEPPPPSNFNPELPPPVEQVILTALRKNPDGRYHSAGEMAAELRNALGLSTEPSVARVSTVEQGDFNWEAIESYISTRRRETAPFQAPPRPGSFVGRETTAAELTALLTEEPGPHVAALTGMGGIGKTALAVRLAHDLRPLYPDGILWANMAASDPLAVLDSWARAFGYDFSSLPDLNSRAAALRGELAGKEVLFIFDDVWSVEDVRPLLPGGDKNGVLITTRDLELPVALGAAAVHLPELTRAESIHLLNQIVGEERIIPETAVAEEICRTLGQLPLAVEIAGRLLLSRRRWRLADLADRLQDTDGRLAALKLLDRAVRTSFGVSFQQLDDAQKQLFAWLAVFGGRPFTPAALAAVAEISVPSAEDHLYALSALSLLTEKGEAHFQQHPLLADFAREQLEKAMRVAGNGRMARYYLVYASKHLDDYPALNQEKENLLAGMEAAFNQEHWQLVTDYADALTPYWFAQGQFTQARRGFAWAAAAAEALVNPLTQINNLIRWGQACIEQGDYSEANNHLTAALQRAEKERFQGEQAQALQHIGRLAIEQGKFSQANQTLESAKSLYETIGDIAGIAQILFYLTELEYYKRNYPESLLMAHQALSFQKSAGNTIGEIQTLRELAQIYLQMDEHLDKAEAYLKHAIQLSHAVHNEGELAVNLYALAEINRRRGNLDVALEQSLTGLQLLQKMGDRKSQSQVLYRLSLIQADQHDYSAALSTGLESLELCKDLNDEQGMIYVLTHLGDVSQNLGYADRARQTWLKAWALAKANNHPLSAALKQKLG